MEKDFNEQVATQNFVVIAGKSQEGEGRKNKMPKEFKSLSEKRKEFKVLLDADEKGWINEKGIKAMRKLCEKEFDSWENEQSEWLPNEYGTGEEVPTNKLEIVTKKEFNLSEKIEEWREVTNRHVRNINDVTKAHMLNMINNVEADVKEAVRLLKEFVNNMDRNIDNMRISRDYTIIEINKIFGDKLI